MARKLTKTEHDTLVTFFKAELDEIEIMALNSTPDQKIELFKRVRMIHRITKALLMRAKFQKGLRNLQLQHLKTRG